MTMVVNSYYPYDPHVIPALKKSMSELSDQWWLNQALADLRLAEKALKDKGSLWPT